MTKIDENEKIPKIKQGEEKWVAHLKDEKFLNMNTIQLLFPWARVFIIKGRKNIGKTYTMIDAMTKIAQRRKKFLYLRITREEADNTSKEWSSDPNIPFYIKAKRFYYKPDEESDAYDCGQVAYLKNLQSLRSQQFNDYEGIFFDEFVAFRENVYGAKAKDQLELAKNFILLITDVQRSKPDLMVWCFGNNNIPIDLFTQYFRADKDNVINYDEENKLVMLNFKDYFKGFKTLGSGLAKYSYQLNDFFASNKSMVDVSRLANYDETHNGLLIYYLVLNGQIYPMIRQVMELEDKSVKVLDQYIITHLNGETNTSLPFIALTDGDYVRHPQAIKWGRIQEVLQFSQWKEMIKRGLIKFTDTNIESEFIKFLQHFDLETLKFL